MNQTELKKYKAILEAKAAELQAAKEEEKLAAE